MSTTDRSTVTGRQSSQGYWRVQPGPGEQHLRRTELAPAAADPGEPLLTIAQLSDLHLCDAQSPARGEFLDRWADDDSPLKPVLPEVGSYRPQEFLTAQVAEAAVRAVNAVTAGPVGGAPLDWAIVTGDALDSAQLNELQWYLAVLEGGPITPDSGSPDRYEGVADHDHWDPYFWHPDPADAPDRPRQLHGFPDAPGLLDAARREFTASGLRLPWLAVHGNHDQLVAGTLTATGIFAAAGTRDTKAIGVPATWSLEQIALFCRDVDDSNMTELGRWDELPVRPITPDPARRPITRHEFLAAHLTDAARPPGHGFPASAAQTGRAYYRHDHGRMTVLVLDTVNEHGGWQGSLDGAQFDWLRHELADADAGRRYTVLASHHTLADLVNGFGPESPAPAERRVLVDEVAAELGRHPSLILWLNGHTHATAVRPHPGPHPWWEVTAPSLVDFPQQGRIVEVLRAADEPTLTIATTMLDHAGEVPWSGRYSDIAGMAGLSRELAANDWQWRSDELSRHRRAGAVDDRNALLSLPDPWR